MCGPETMVFENPAPHVFLKSLQRSLSHSFYISLMEDADISYHTYNTEKCWKTLAGLFCSVL